MAKAGGEAIAKANEGERCPCGFLSALVFALVFAALSKIRFS